MQRFLVLHRIPEGTNEAGFRRTLQSVAEAADRVGVDVKETVFNLQRGQAWSLFEAEREELVREAVDQGGLPAADVIPAQLVYTELLSEPHRAR